MPFFSYHGGHSGQFCSHAKGRLEEVVEAAIAAGFSHYGLSEHCPRDQVEYLYPEEVEAGPDRLSTLFDDYMTEARRLQEAYAGRIELLVGFETERLPLAGWAERMTGLRERYRADYIVGSVHDVDGTWVDFSPEMTARAAEEAGGRQALEVKYFEHLAELVSTLRPEVVGHLDLIRKFDGPDARLTPAGERAALQTLEAVSATGAVLDVNPGAFRRGLSPVYPGAGLLSQACKMGVGVTLGDDGHGAHDVGAGLSACLQAIAAAGYREVHYLERREGQTRLARAALSDVRPQLGS